ncbi:MAG: hypothetical protein NC043_00840 [Muribaculaceae bacterium]|nr:hypothetical protein [Muribaculaceae bacterium]
MLRLLFAIFVLVPYVSFAGSTEPKLSDIVNALSVQADYAGGAEFIVSMPQLAEDVKYNVSLHQQAAEGDALAPCRYLIEWELTGRDEPVTGFSAYYDGHHYRFSGQKLQEYHMEWDSIPFRPSILRGMQGAGVQRTAQFTDLLPAFIAEKLGHMATDSLYAMVMHPDTVINGEHRAAIDVVMTVRGTTAMEGEYVFDHESLMPVSVTLENNPGSISEQTIYVKYSPVASEASENINEEMLMARYPEAFERYRMSNFRVENLRGARLPAFSVPTTTGERYSREAADPFRAPTVLAIMDSGQGFNRDMINSLRQAMDALPFSADLIMAFADSHVDGIEEAAGTVREGEHLLMSARGLARDCGVASYPTVLIVKADGTVADVMIGYNNDISSSVIQKMTLINN